MEGPVFSVVNRRSQSPPASPGASCPPTPTAGEDHLRFPLLLQRPPWLYLSSPALQDHDPQGRQRACWDAPRRSGEVIFGAALTQLEALQRVHLAGQTQAPTRAVPSTLHWPWTPGRRRIGEHSPRAVPRGVGDTALPVAEATGQVQDARCPHTGPSLPWLAHPIPEATFPSAKENTRIANTGTGSTQESLGPSGQGSAAGSHARRPAPTAENFIS